MPDHDSFLRMICANPQDDGPRLVYADFLEEEGDGDRAEFIRLQIKMATCRMCHRKDGSERKDSYAANCGRCVPGKRHELELLMKHTTKSIPSGTLNFQWDDWSLPRHVTAGWGHLLNGGANFTTGILFRRGFIESVSLSWPDWLRHHEAIRSAQPVTKVRLTSWPEIDRGEHPPGVRGWAAFRNASGPNWRISVSPSTSDQDVTKILLTHQYPGITFELPPARPAGFDVQHIQQVANGIQISVAVVEDGFVVQRIQNARPEPVSVVVEHPINGRTMFVFIPPQGSFGHIPFGYPLFLGRDQFLIVESLDGTSLMRWPTREHPFGPRARSTAFRTAMQLDPYPNLIRSALNLPAIREPDRILADEDLIS